MKKYRHKPTKKVIAVKFLLIPRNQIDDELTRTNFKAILREIENLRLLNDNPNIVDFFGLCIHEGVALICMEKMDLSLRELYIIVHKQGICDFPENLVGCIFVSMIDALLFCKDRGVIHRDIKPSNILVNYRYENF